MDRLDLAAQAERVNRLLNAQSQAVLDEFDEYGEVLDILWEREFKPISLRILEVAAKLPIKNVQVSFIREIIREIIAPLSSQEIAGLLSLVIIETFLHRMPPMGMAIPLIFAPDGKVIDDRRGRPGVA